MQLPIHVWFTSATIIMLCFYCLNTVISVQSLTVLSLYLFCPVLSVAYVISNQIWKFRIPGFRCLLAYLQLSAASPPNKRRYLWEVCMCIFYLCWVCNWYRLLVASLTVNIVPIMENSLWCLVKLEGECSGYCDNLGSLRAGTRHHGDQRVRCSPA